MSGQVEGNTIMDNGHGRPMVEYWLGVDLGQAQDYTALSLIEKIYGRQGGPGAQKVFWPPSEVQYHVSHLERIPLNTSYPKIVETVGARMEAIRRERGRKNSEGFESVAMNLAVDGTGVGRAVVDMLKVVDKGLWAVTITGGDAVTNEGKHFKVPKRDLVGLLQALMQTRRLKVADALPEAATLMHELQNFKYKISIAGHDSYEAWRESVHDDLVLSVAIACWCGNRRRVGHAL